jgi:cAMP-dependent protein kinase regulator
MRQLAFDVLLHGQRVHEHSSTMELAGFLGLVNNSGKWPSMDRKAATLELIRRKILELNFNINDEVVNDVYELFKLSRSPGDEAQSFEAYERGLDIFINNLASNAILQKLQANAGVNDGEEFDRTWTISRKNSVYAESVTPETFELEYYPKDEETVNFLNSIMVSDIPFELLNYEQKMKLIGSAVPSEVKAGTVIIEEGGYGSQMYIVESGEFEVIRSSKVLRRLVRGSYFGEIALMHNIPRTATVRAVRDSKIWAIEQKSFAGIKMVDRVINKKIVLQGFKEQRIFPLIGEEDYNIIVDALSFVFYRAGKSVEVRDNEFFMVLYDGEIDAGDDVRKVRAKEVLTNSFIAITDIQGAHVRKKQREYCSIFYNKECGI